MSAIWHNGGDGWRLLAPSGFPAENALHSLVEQEPQILPLAGSPNLVILGREVRLGAGYADLIAVEPSGRLVVIEVKLAHNPEARRAVVSQVLAYASYLFNSSIHDLEGRVLANHLAQRGFSSIADAIRSSDQSLSFDEVDFREALEQTHREGRFRLVLVLDSAPDELVQVASFLSAISDKLLIDLIAVSSYEVNGSQIVVPQRVTPETKQAAKTDEGAGERTRASGTYLPSSEAFRNSIQEADESIRGDLTRIADWADALVEAGLADVVSSLNKGRWRLIPRLPVSKTSLVTLFNARDVVKVQFWRSAFERYAPESIERIEQLIAPAEIEQAKFISGHVSPELLDALTQAYREAVR
jgi:hypothetical protein